MHPGFLAVGVDEQGWYRPQSPGFRLSVDHPAQVLPRVDLKGVLRARLAGAQIGQPVAGSGRKAQQEPDGARPQPRHARGGLSSWRDVSPAPAVRREYQASFSCFPYYPYDIVRQGNSSEELAVGCSSSRITAWNSAVGMFFAGGVVVGECCDGLLGTLRLSGHR